MSKEIIEIEHIRSGQPRAYADSVYESKIIIRVEGTLLNNGIFYRELNINLVKQLTQMFVRPFKETKGFLEPYLELCEPIGPTKEMIEKAHPKWVPKENSRWRVIVVEPYSD